MWHMRRGPERERLDICCYLSMYAFAFSFHPSPGTLTNEDASCQASTAPNIISLGPASPSCCFPDIIHGDAGGAGLESVSSFCSSIVASVRATALIPRLCVPSSCPLRYTYPRESSVPGAATIAGWTSANRRPSLNPKVAHPLGNMSG